MASNNSPESPSKKRKQSSDNTHLRRDQPLFNSRRPNGPLPLPSEFHTESLNTSHIPSPSPTKSPTHAQYQAKPRQARHRKAVSAGLQPPFNYEPNKDTRHEKLPIGGHRGNHRKSETRHGVQQPTPTSAPQPQEPARARTPTPPRGRLATVQSSPANSDPSPGRGYGEAYQRIEEEEYLAQDESTDNIDLEQFDNSMDSGSLSLEIPNTQPAKASGSLSPKRSPPPPLRSQSSPVQQQESVENHIDDIQQPQNDIYNMRDEDITRSSLDSASSRSRYEKDLQRLQKLKGRPKAFSKALIGETGGLTSENLKRHGSNESLRSSQGTGDFSVSGSEPGVNVPKAWGRKARPGYDWLSRITGDQKRPDVHHTNSAPGAPDRKTPGLSRGNAKVVDAWIAAAAENPLPDSSVVASSNSTKEIVPEPNRELTWNLDDEFTGRSLQVSDSPPMRFGRSAFDPFNRPRVNGGLQGPPVHRLGQLRERTSDTDLTNHQVLPSKNAQASSEPQYEELEGLRRVSSDPSSRSKFRNVENSIHGVLGDVGDAVANTPVVVYKNRNGVNGVNANNHAAQRDTRRPEHQRRDSHDLLKRLARAASESPSPDKENRDPRPIIEEPVQSAGKTPQVTKPTKELKTPMVTGAWVDQSTIMRPQVSTLSKNMKTPHVTGGWVDTPLPAQSRPQERPLSLTDIKEEPTETSLGAADLVRELSPNVKPKPHINNKHEQSLPYTGPPIPKSALQSILDQAKGFGKPRFGHGTDTNEDPTLNLGEQTIESLEDLVVRDGDAEASTIIPASKDPREAAADYLAIEQADNLQDNPDERKIGNNEPSQSSLLKRLVSLAPSLRDSKRQIAALERTLSDPASSLVTNQAEAEAETACHEAGELHDFILPCAKCRHRVLSSSSYSAPSLSLPRPTNLHFSNNLTIPTWSPAPGVEFLFLPLPIPRLFTWPADSWRPRLTWLGVLLVLWLMHYLYWVANEVACLYYCQPTTALWYDGYGVDITRPRPPHVFLKVVWQYWGLGWLVGALRDFVGGEWMMVVWRVMVFVFRGIWGLFAEEQQGGGRGAVPVSQDQRIPRPEWGPDLSMMNDEYL